MITWQAANYAKVLFSLGLNEDEVKESSEILLNNRELLQVLDNPVIKDKEKEAVIDKIFTKEIGDFLKVLSTNKSIGLIDNIYEEYESLILDSKNIAKAKLSYVTRPDETELVQIKDMICNKYDKAGVNLELEEDASLIGGYVITIGNTVYDKSMKGTLLELKKALARR